MQILPGNEISPGGWSPDGKEFAFRHYHGSETHNGKGWYTQISSVDADGTNVHPLTEPHVELSLGSPYWSPDGSQIAVAWDGAISPTYSYRFHLLKLATGEVQTFNAQVRGTNWDQDTFVWSPDGKWVAFLTDGWGSDYVRPGIQAVNLETGEVFCITQDASLGEQLFDWR